VNRKYQTSPQYNDLRDWVLKLPDYFENHGESIFKSRNEVKVFELKNKLLNVKAFKVPNWINQVVYVYLRASKARRSFLYARKFQDLKICTPEPVAYIECHSGGLLKKSYYISRHCQYDFTLREVLNYQVENREELLRQWVGYTYEKLHRNGIFHRDYSPGNTLINITKEGTVFNIIDLNRMSFKKISFKEGLRNFRQLDTDLPTIELIAREYAALIGENPQKAIQLLTEYHLENVASRQRHMRMKQRIKNFFRSGRDSK
jgi:tRNA A-37 threonylcarbamoyl transferase component Bud32